MYLIVLGLGIFGLVTSTVFTGMVLAAVASYLRERRTLAHMPVQGFTPSLSLLKPLHGAEPDLDTHLASFFEQDYPEFEILFCSR